MIERKVTVVRGLNEAARSLNVSRGHLSLVMHGKRFSRTLLSRLYAEYGWRPGGAATLEVAANIKRGSPKAVKKPICVAGATV
jgi:hypothetical protein